MANQTRKAQTLYRKVLVPMVLVAFLHVVILIFLLNASGIFYDLRSNALEMLDERTQNKRQTIQSNMTGRWSGLTALSQDVLAQIDNQLSLHNATAGDVKTDAALSSDIVTASAPALLSALRTTGATGVFLILDGETTPERSGSYAGLYLRDADPQTVSADQSDVLMARGLPVVGRTMHIALDSNWKGSFTFAPGEGDFFYRPLEAARQGGLSDTRDYGMWMGPFHMDDQTPVTMITYSEPLIDRNGTVLGVIGTELTTGYLSSLLENGESAQSRCFVLAKTENGQDFQCAFASGALYGIHFEAGQTAISAHKWENEHIMTLTGSRSGASLYGSVHSLRLYNGDSPLEKDSWVLIGLQNTEDTLAFMNSTTQVLLVSGALALLIGLFIALITSNSITRPITRLIGQLEENSNADKELNLQSTSVREIDILAQTIIQQSREAADQAQRLSSILSVTGTSVGVYELQANNDSAYCSRGVYQLFGLDDGEYNDTNLSRFQLRRLLDSTLTDEVDDGVWRIHTTEGVRYLRHRQLRQGGSLFGALTDVTTELENRYRIEHERDYDVLTNLLNRRAFARDCHRLFEKEPEKLKVAAVLMMDLDNLKFLNDTYGHDWGDNYIKAFAKALNVFEGPTSICGRRSGDEFYALLYGRESREELNREIQEKWHRLTSVPFKLPGDKTSRLRASGGIAWYPDDSLDFETLVRYADVAMYKVKQSAKGVLHTFDPELYARDMQLLNNRGELIRMLDDRLVKYVFQPIASARTGELLGYELLMRPLPQQLSSPMDVLELAKQQGVLHHVERLTWTCALETASRMVAEGKLDSSCKLFINSIANQILDPREEEMMVNRYRDLLGRVVLEVTESENNNQNYTTKKQKFIRSHGGVVAIDDYGTGYNSELILIQLPCEYVKLDISFVRDVDKDIDKQTIVRNLMSYARRKNISVLCEGVESEEELAQLISYDVDYIQGYYVGRPADEPKPIPEHVKETIQRLMREKNMT